MPSEIELKIDRVNPENVVPVYVNDMLINHSDNEFFITFSLIEPPTFLDPSDAEGIDSIQSVARVKIAATPKFIKSMAKALEINIARFEKRQRAEDDSSNGD